MTKRTGVSSLSPERILMGPGAVYIGANQMALLGATKGGNVLEINRTFRDIRPDGSYGKVKGYRQLENVEAILTVRLVEVTDEIVKYALAGSSLSSHVITGGDIVAATYISEMSIVAELTGITSSTEDNAVEIAMTNCLVEGPFTLSLPETGETVVELKFHAHFVSTALHTEPWTITFTHVT